MLLRVSSRKWSVFRRKVCVLIEVITESLNKDEVTGFPGVPVVKNPLLMQVRSLNREDSLEKEMATHSSTLAWRIPWTEEPGR